ncbi:polysaccharide deacetylase family protein [Candidatus Parcubacteria bacterium]|nr:polysaccharide deacetylase family protein [Candidatus Parcubacteria bacterium]
MGYALRHNLLHKETAKFKTYFFIVSGIIFVCIVGGTFYLKNNPYFSLSYLLNSLTFVKYKVEYASSSNENIFRSIGQFFTSGTSYEVPATSETAVPVLAYHGILKNVNVDPSQPSSSQINISIDDFKNQMFLLKRAGYTTITTAELEKFLRGELKLPKKAILITFDDGRTDSYRYADPILKALDYKAVMFAITRYSLLSHKNDYYLSREQLQQMENSSRWDIEAHTRDGHNYFDTGPNGEKGAYYSNKLWIVDQNRLETTEEFQKRIYDDFKNAKSDLEDALNKKVIAFAFPFGDFGQYGSNFPDAEKIVQDTISRVYTLGFYQGAPGVRFGANYNTTENQNTNFKLVRRLDVNAAMSPQDLLHTLENFSAKNLPYNDTFATNNGWVPAWGQITLEPHAMTLKPRVSQAGAASILDGTNLWTDYSVRAHVSAPPPGGAFVWIRFMNDVNNADCNFGRDFVHIEQTINGNSHVIKGVRDNFSLPETDFEVGIDVKGRDVTCLVNGVPIVETQFLDPSLTHGGIGFKTWNVLVNNTLLIVKDLHVSPL